MSSSRDTLDSLMPLSVGGDWDGLLAGTANALDRLDTEIDRLMQELHPDTAVETVPTWERMLDLPVIPDMPTEARRERIIAAATARPVLLVSYFLHICAMHGHPEAVVDEPMNAMCGWAECGDPLGVDGVEYYLVFYWSDGEDYYARTGTTGCGEALFDARDDVYLIGALDRIRPAHMIFAYNP